MELQTRSAPNSESALVTRIPSDDFLPSDDAAQMLGLSPRTLERFRLEGRGPSYFKFGRVVRYRRSTMLAWAEAQMRTSTSDPGLAA